MLLLDDLFEESYYLQQNPDVNLAVTQGGFNSGLEHFLQWGQGEGRTPSAWYNEAYYLEQYPDVAAAVAGQLLESGLTHYLRFGQQEGRNPSVLFDEQFYQQQNPDVAEAIDPVTGFSSELHHYLTYGEGEGRIAYSRIVPFWDEAAQQAVRNTSPGPTIASRAYGLVHTAMFDTWAAYDSTAIATQPENRLQRPREENTELNKSEAMSYAAYYILSQLFPSQIEFFNTQMQQLGYNPSPRNPDSNTASGLGYFVAENLLEFRQQDGSNALNNYQDITGYQPVNHPDILSDRSRWQPLREPLDDPNGRIQTFLTPHWGNVIPFALNSGAQFRPPEPLKVDSPEFAQQMAELIEINANLNDRQKIIAEFWEDGAGTSFPPGTWMTFAQWISDRQTHSLDRDIQLFFTLSNALFDAGIACWETKTFYDSVRPVTAIRNAFAGEMIQGWGGPGQGTQTLDGAQWQPYQRLNNPTPPFSEYVSGHSTFSAAAAEILQRFTGSDEFGAAVTIAVGDSFIEPGVTPTTEITLSWPTFSAAADESGLSRIYGGIHFNEGDINGRELGRKVGEIVWNRAQFWIQGIP
ncbi:vanadium-dependent haloperoxidase [Oscillatoria sp. HE19RPO]|uniref:vanadium-dependent haloperoxidase n=1 Tax=Oscillatoria sp. HE19RPO TaxID=2954806 RepID=UPI0020C37AD9|nr:vanadium-dependent haloperoxidase [Oscillatoria sp. HE19RPO]